MAWNWDILPWPAAGLLMLALAAVLLRFGFGRRVNQALALALVLHGLMDLSAFVRLAPDAAGFVSRVFPYLWLPLAPAFLYFASVYPERRPWIPAGRWGSVPVLALVFAFPLLYFVDHGLYEGTGPWGAYPGTGPLVVATSLLHVTYGLIAFLFARSALSAPPGSRRRGLLLGSIAFALIHLFDATMYLAEWRGGLPPPGAPPATWVLLAADVVALLVFVQCGALVARHVLRESDRATRRTIRAYAVLLALAVSLAVAVVAARGAPALVVGSLRWVLSGLWDLTFPIILAYGVLRHQFLDIDLRIRWTIRRGTIAGVFIAVFIVAMQIADKYLDDWGPLVGGATAGLLIFVLSPLQRFAERVADAALPRPRAPRDLSHPERLDTFRSAAVAAWDDGHVDARERHVLDHLRDALGLSHEEAARLETEAAGLTQPPVARGPEGKGTGAAPPP